MEEIGITKRRKKRKNNFNPTETQVKNAVDEYLKGGGIITVFETVQKPHAQS